MGKEAVQGMIARTPLGRLGTHLISPLSSRSSPRPTLGGSRGSSSRHPAASICELVRRERNMGAAVDKERFGPWALVTGASSGIGKEFARQIAASGIAVRVIWLPLALEARFWDLAGTIVGTASVAESDSIR
jgi:hypothetical protein